MTKKELSSKLFELYFLNNYPIQYMKISNDILKNEIKEKAQKPKPFFKKLIKLKVLKI